MAQATGTYSTYDGVGLREELGNDIYDISPQETPLFTMLSKKSCKSKKPI